MCVWVSCHMYMYIFTCTCTQVHVNSTDSLCGIVQVILKGHHQQRSHAAPVLQAEPPALTLKSVNEHQQELLVHDQRLEGLEILDDLLLVRFLR